MSEQPRLAPPPPQVMNGTAQADDSREEHCPQHGAFTATRYLRHWTTCPTCVERRRAEEDSARQADQEVRRRRHAADRLRWAGLVGRLEGATFDSFDARTKDQRAVLTACREFAEQLTCDSGSGLLLIGPPGTGKTHLLSAIVRHVVQSKRAMVHKGETHMVERGAEIITVRDLIRRLRATWKRDAGESEAEAIEHFGRDLDLLALDEVGASFGSEAEQVQLLDVIDLRYRLRRPTVIASNLNVPGLQSAIGERSFDRLREGARILLCTWPSHRGPKA